MIFKKDIVRLNVKETDNILYIKVSVQTIETTEDYVFYIENAIWIQTCMIEGGDVGISKYQQPYEIR